MGRKPKFIVRKCEEKRRRLRRSIEPSELIVSIPREVILLPSESLTVRLPLSAYRCATVDDSAQLRSRLLKSGSISPGWVIAEENTCLPDSTSPIILYRPVESQVLVLSAGTAFSVSIDTDLSWTVRVGTSPVDCQTDVFRGCTATINNIDQVIKLLSCIDMATLCVGNSDSKFNILTERHKHYFRSATGKPLHYHKHYT